MSARDGLIIALPENEGGEPLWTRIVDGAVVQEGAGINWLAACGLAALPKDCVEMLVPPASLTVLHWIYYPRSDEHTSDLQSLMRISYAVFCLTKKKTIQTL